MAQLTEVSSIACQLLIKYVSCSWSSSRFPVDAPTVDIMLMIPQLIVVLLLIFMLVSCYWSSSLFSVEGPSVDVLLMILQIIVLKKMPCWWFFSRYPSKWFSSKRGNCWSTSRRPVDSPPVGVLLMSCWWSPCGYNIRCLVGGLRICPV